MLTTFHLSLADILLVMATVLFSALSSRAYWLCYVCLCVQNAKMARCVRAVPTEESPDEVRHALHTVSYLQVLV